MIKKIIPALLAAALLLSAVACSGGDKPAGTGDETSETTLVMEPSALNELISSIGEATIENEKKIDEAYLAYWSMPEEGRAMVTKYDELLRLRSELTKKYVVKEYKDSRIPHERILIGGYGWRYGSDEEAQALVDSHFDFMWNCSVETLERFGLGAFCYAGFLGFPVSKNMSEEEFRAAVEGKNFDRPNLWCIDFLDEPSRQDLIKLWNTGKIVSEELLPQCGFIMNLVPLYATADDVPEYDKLLDAYCDTVGSVNDIISFDHYIYAPENAHYKIQGESRTTSMLKNFQMLSDRCIENGYDLYAIIQNVDVWKADPNTEGFYTVSADMMKFQAYIALAFGSKAIVWFETGYPAGTPVNADGTRNEAYDKLEEVNGDVKALEPVYMRYTFDSNVVICGKASRKLRAKIDFYDGSRNPADLKQTAITDVTAGNPDVIVTGHFKKNVGEGDAFMFVPLSTSDFQEGANQTSSISFRTTDPDAVVTAYRRGIPTVLKAVDGVYTVTINGTDAVFVTVG